MLSVDIIFQNFLYYLDTKIYILGNVVRLSQIINYILHSTASRSVMIVDYPFTEMCSCNKFAFQSTK
jgi:hypothetical protein